MRLTISGGAASELCPSCRANVAQTASCRGTLLFPRDPIRNAPEIIRNLATVFPAREGSYMFGLLAKIGWFSPTLVQYANSLLKHKVMFGSDYPLLTPDRWLADFDRIGIKDDVRPLILRENAIRLLGLGSGPSRPSQSSGTPT